ncbi:hypothetical protein BC827DRAFT_1210056 [Russula dissimulans]|nr:hypothetical protein BC827DRAFT_1210056 [Russula dissimulans]
MPAIRSSHRRRSSLALLSVNPLKHGNYGIGQASPKGVTFAPNITPVTFVEPDSDSLDSDPSSPSSSLFPPAATPAPPSRKRCPPGKRRSQGYIPRPPNAFMLFRADFVRQKHVPGSIETNHGSLSKIIGNCWRALPLEEKRVWEIKAKHAKAEHKQMYPNYRFRPVHNKNKEKKPKTLIPAEDEKRCEDVAQLLLEGMKGEELAAAVKRLDRMRSATPLSLPRRPSSVPLPNSFPISIPALPFVQPSRPHSPQHMNPPRHTLPRRPSSAGPSLYRSWTDPFNLPREPSPMPEINASLFNGAYLDNAFPSSSTQSDASFVSCINFRAVCTLTTIESPRTSIRCLAPSRLALHHRKCSSPPSRVLRLWKCRTQCHPRLTRTLTHISPSRRLPFPRPPTRLHLRPQTFLCLCMRCSPTACLKPRRRGPW